MKKPNRVSYLRLSHSSAVFLSFRGAEMKDILPQMNGMNTDRFSSDEDFGSIIIHRRLCCHNPIIGRRKRYLESGWELGGYV